MRAADEVLRYSGDDGRTNGEQIAEIYGRAMVDTICDAVVRAAHDEDPTLSWDAGTTEALVGSFAAGSSMAWELATETQRGMDGLLSGEPT